MIAEPANDEACLGAVTRAVAELVERRDPALVSVAGRFGTTDELAAWIRSLPQRDDLGAPADGPKVEACQPPQRLRIPAPDPNCVERGALYVGAAELIDPGPVRSLATIDVPGGLHTLPIEDGEPVILDPRVRRNVAAAGLFKLGRRRNGQGRVTMTPAEAIDWLAELAMEPARCFPGGVARVEGGREAMHDLLAGAPLDDGDVADIAFVLALADHESRLFGPTGRRVLTCTTRAMDALDGQVTGARRNGGPGVRVGGYRVRPDAAVLGRLARVGGRLGYRVGVAALRERLATLGVAPGVLSTLEAELNREGLSLGPLGAPPPMPGTLAAVTPEAALGRWLAARL